MKACNSKSVRLPRLGRLAACLALALATGDVAAQTLLDQPFPAAAVASPAFLHIRIHPPKQRYKSVSTDPPIEVTSCADNQTVGTLRYEIFHAPEGGTVDMSNLMCSTITLANGAIVIAQHSLSVTASASNPIRVDAHGASRVIEGNNASASTPGTLYLKDLELANGYFRSDSSSYNTAGGCVYWPGSSSRTLTLQSTTVTGCNAVNAAGFALGGAIASFSVNAYDSTILNSVANGLKVGGGGIFAVDAYLRDSVVSGNLAFSSVNGIGAYAHGGGIEGYSQLRLVRSIVAQNLAKASYGSARGGGVYDNAYNQPGYARIAYSTISGNRALSAGSSGGGVSAVGTLTIANSTIDHNQSVNNSAVSVSGNSGETVLIRNSTISTNTATTGSSAIFASIPLNIFNSTIAFNVAAGTSAGVYLYPGGNMGLGSTIIANNTSSAGGGFDLVSRATVTGSHNLIQNPKSTLPLSVAIVGVDPLLGSLVNNGGETSTHALKIGSPAIDTGSNPRDLRFDQRGPGFARVAGAAADIGAYESNSDRIFANGFE